METCGTVKLQCGVKCPRMVWAKRPHRVQYFHILDPRLGRIHVRLETWFPFSIQVCTNGHGWLARQMLANRLGFDQRDNTLVKLDDPPQSRTLAGRFCRPEWVQILVRLARKCKPLHKQAWLRDSSHYWVAGQAECSTDVIFRNRATLDELSPGSPTTP